MQNAHGFKETSLDLYLSTALLKKQIPIYNTFAIAKGVFRTWSGPEGSSHKEEAFVRWFYLMNEDLFMNKAIELAKKALSCGEVPVGAVVVKNGEIIGEGYNRRENKMDISSHAEIEALRAAALKTNDWRLDGCSLFVTLEPCLMCSGAILQSRISSLYFGARDARDGAVLSKYFVFDDPSIHLRPLIHPDFHKEECERLLKEFFSLARQDV